MADNVTATGKYFLVSVPEFADDPVGDRKGQKMTSFLRLGAYHEHPEAEEVTKRAYDLAALALAVSQCQGGHLTEPYGAEIDCSTTGMQVLDDNGNVTQQLGAFLDDQRYDNDGTLTDTDGSIAAVDSDFPPVGTMPIDQRLEQSNALLTRGGWWDHSDGNRISTTYGDKVEVVRGNYKMVIMQRQDDPSGGGGWDVSGGQMQDLGPNSMPGASLRVEFRPSMWGKGKGAWHLENTTNNFIQTSDYAGDFFEHHYGNFQQVTTGSESPQDFNDDLQKPYGNPEITTKTWASKIEEYTGSSGWRIPSISGETYAKTTSDLTDVSGDIHETTYCDGTIHSKSGKIDRRIMATEETSYVNMSNSVTDVLLKNELTTIGASASTTIAGGIVDISVIGAHEEIDLSVQHLSVEVCPLRNDVFVGMQANLFLGLKKEFFIGKEFKEYSFPKKEESDATKTSTAVTHTTTAVTKSTTAVTNKQVAVTHDIVGTNVKIGS